MSIPKVIHYCWFGKQPKSELVNKCIASWRKMAPDYRIVEWNEDNFDINTYAYAKEAYELKKYAFVSDVARFHVLQNEGGIYLDTDVELLKPLEQFLDNDLFMGYSRDGLVSSGLITGSVANHPFLDKILDYYKENRFLLANGRPNTTTVCTIVSNLLKMEGIDLNGEYIKRHDIVLYPAHFFDPYDYEQDKMYLTDTAYAIHHYAASWKSEKDIKIYKVGLLIKKIFGKSVYAKLAKIKHKIYG